MLDIIICELMKLRRSKIILICTAGVMATPCMMLIEALQTHFEHPEKGFTLSDIYSNSLLYVMLLINMMIYVAVTAYLFSREYSENTLKSILPVPVSRHIFILGKFTVLLLIVIVLTFITWVGIFVLSGIYNIFIGMEEYSLLTALRWLGKFIVGNVIVFFTLSPFAYIAQKAKGLVAPMVFSAVIVMANAVLCNQKFGVLSPWTSPYLLIHGRAQNSGYPVWLSVLIIILTSFIGFLIAFEHFKREDLK